jgi:hypothetical protein
MFATRPFVFSFGACHSSWTGIRNDRGVALTDNLLRALGAATSIDFRNQFAHSLK